MDAPETIQPIAPGQRFHRSSVSNGSRLFAVVGADGRTQTARRWRDLHEFMVADLGGESMLSEGQRQLIRRACTLSVMAEATEGDIVRDLACDLNSYGTICDRLRRILETLGLQRVAKPVKGLHDCFEITKE